MSINSIDGICRFTVAEWLTHLAATLEVMGSRPSLGDIARINTVSCTEGFKMVCVTLWNLLRPAMYAVLTGK